MDRGPMETDGIAVRGIMAAAPSRRRERSNNMSTTITTAMRMTTVAISIR